MEEQNVLGVTEQMKNRNFGSSPAPPRKAYLYNFFVYYNMLI